MSTIISNHQLEKINIEDYNTITDIKIKNLNNDLLPIIFQLTNLKTLHLNGHKIPTHVNLDFNENGKIEVALLRTK